LRCSKPAAPRYGIDARLIDVEVDMYQSGSARDFLMVGMPDIAVREPRAHQVRPHQLGVRISIKVVTINLAPANVGKEGGIRSADGDRHPPVTTPYRRVRIRRFRGLSYRPPVSLGISERVEVRDGQGDIEARLCAEKSEDSRPGPLLPFALQSNAAGPGPRSGRSSIMAAAPLAAV
jgi:hypothetical protein